MFCFTVYSNSSCAILYLDSRTAVRSWKFHPIGCWPMFQANETIRYLEFCVSSMNVQEQAIHNYLLTLYAQHKPDRLMRYLAMEGELQGVDCGKLRLRSIHHTKRWPDISVLVPSRNIQKHMTIQSNQLTSPQLLKKRTGRAWECLFNGNFIYCTLKINLCMSHWWDEAVSRTCLHHSFIFAN